jgi:TRIAD3 protein (E3 ubiquitin-protein ligase RNF216)
MYQCADGHLFCKGCVTRHAETKLGEQLTVSPLAAISLIQSIDCMDTSGCSAIFPESELGRLLDAKALGLYHRLKQAKELEDAEIDGFETCPNCPWGAVIDNPNERLFRCMNDDCKQVSCRKCRKQVSFIWSKR